MKADPALRSIPFVIYTATYTGIQDEEFALKIGAARFIQKPCEPDILLQAVLDVVAEQPRRVEEVIPPIREEEVLKLYNERLVRKLEQKMLQLEQEVKVRQQTEVILRRSEERYRTLFNSIRDGILVCDTDGQIVDCNPAFLTLFRCPKDVIVGVATQRLYESETAFNDFDIVRMHPTTDRDGVRISFFRRLDGTTFPAEVHVYPLTNDEGSVAGYVGIIRDITERRQAEQEQHNLQQQLMQAQKMESVGRLAGGVAHDFNNLLSIIIGYGDLVQRSLGAAHPCSQPLNHLHEASLRAVDLTRQLLAFSRKQVMEMKTVNVNEVIVNFEKLISRLLGEDIRLTLSLSNELLIVRTDTSQLEQVLMNLAVNARDAMEAGGELQLSTMSVTPESSVPDDGQDMPSCPCARIRISDTGCGMDKETLKHIFEPFFTTKAENKGTGLGLATTYGIIRQHGGVIRVSSVKGQGTTVDVYLPLTDAEVITAHPIVDAPVSRTEAVTILLVEDEVPLRALLRQILENGGFSVIESESPQDAIEQAGAFERPLALVLTDVVMPGMKGPDVFARVRVHHPEARVLFMSGYSEETILHQVGMQDGFSYIQKPFTAHQLINRCERVLLSAIG